VVLFKEEEQNKDFGEIEISPTLKFNIKEYRSEIEKNKPILNKMESNFKRANFRYYIHNKNKEKLKKLINDSLSEKK
jgi:hypothetical protein